MLPELVALLNATFDDAPTAAVDKSENVEESEDDLGSTDSFTSCTTVANIRFQSGRVPR